MELIRLENLLIELRTRLFTFTNRISFIGDDYEDLLKLSNEIDCIRSKRNMPILIQCERRKTTPKYIANVAGMVGYPDWLLVIRAFDPQQPTLGVQDVLPRGGLSGSSQSPTKIIELLDRSIRYVAVQPKYTEPLFKSVVRKLYGISERQFLVWLKTGKIPHIDNQKRTIRLELSEYQRITNR